MTQPTINWDEWEEITFEEWNKDICGNFIDYIFIRKDIKELYFKRKKPEVKLPIVFIDIINSIFDNYEDYIAGVQITKEQYGADRKHALNRMLIAWKKLQEQGK